MNITDTAKNEHTYIRNRMRVIFNMEGYNLNVTINECPGDYKVVVCNYYYESFEVTSDGHITKVLQNPKFDNILIDMNNFFHELELTKPAAKLFIKLLGFIPFFKDPIKNYDTRGEIIDAVCDNRLHVTHVPKCQPMPVTMTEFLGVQIPKALVNRMQTYVGLKDSIGEEEFTIAHIPEVFHPHLTTALEKLNRRAKYTVNDLAVYNFLGFLDMFMCDPMCICEDELIPDTINDVALKGYIGEQPQIMFEYSERDIDLDNPLLTNSMIELLPSYKKLASVRRNAVDIKIMQVYFDNIKVRSDNITKK